MLVAYRLPTMTAELVTDTWPYAQALKDLRANAGGLSVERAAARIDVSRSTWNAWEVGKQRPGHDSLKAIVEAFECPPELVFNPARVAWPCDSLYSSGNTWSYTFDNYAYCS